jgi:precorrin-6Y C5,15-methyltransferase (decarboxylating)
LRKGQAVALDAKIHILGVGNDGLGGLTGRARELLQRADLVLGSEATLGLVRELKAERLAIGPDLAEVVQTLENNLGKKRMVVVASGDPLFYGVARYLCDRLGKDHFEVLPHVSSMQLAFARVKESWEEAYLTNLATHSLETVLDRVRTADTVGLFTSENDDPPRIARQLLARGLDYFRAYVCENLGGPDERVTQGELGEIADMEFAPLNVMILKRKPEAGRISRARRPASAASAIRTTCSPRANPRAASSPSLKFAPSPWLSSISSPPTSCGTSAPAPARSPSKRPSWRFLAWCMRSSRTWPITT